MAEIKLNVEDGSLVEGANTYVSLEFADEYMAVHGKASWAENDEETRKSKLIAATEYIDSLYNWKGVKKTPYQDLCFPREGIVDYDGYEVLGIPKNLQKAVCEAAFIALTQDLFITSDSNGAVKKMAIEDATEIEYFNSGETKAEWTSVYQVLDTLLKGLYHKKDAPRSICVPVRWV
ncbi:MAG: hypothetical protein J6V90_07960 [Treponema sp.]|nr:hypothetical protein [Treponema sp.]